MTDLTQLLPDEAIEALRKHLQVHVDLIVTPREDSIRDPLNQQPNTVGVKVSLTLPSRPEPARVVINGPDGITTTIRGERQSTHLGVYGWILTDEKANELRYWVLKRYEIPKGRIGSQATYLEEGALAPDPS